ncbi:MAG: BCD family MFS transporter [Gemmatimonadaceae bacterium]
MARRPGRMQQLMVSGFTKLDPKWLPFADAATTELPLGRILRLGLFQLAVGMAAALLTGTLNRVMIVELHVPTTLVAVMVSIPLLVAPFRAFLGFRSDTHRSALGWRRVPFIWFGSLIQFGGLAIMPFALILLSGDTHGSVAAARTMAALAFLLVGAGAYVTQTAGLALANDLAPERVRPRIVALLYIMLLLGIVCSSLIFGLLLQNFSQLKLIKVVQGAAMVTMVLNMIAMWKQEPRTPMSRTEVTEPRPRFRDAWRVFIAGGDAIRLLVVVALGTFAFNMQDVLLEPYGAQILGLSVSATTSLTAIFSAGSILAFAFAGRVLLRGTDAGRLTAAGVLIGAVGFAAVVFAAPLSSAMLFRAGTALIGFGEGLFAVGTLTFAMNLPDAAQHGIALGAWGAVFAVSEGLALASSGLLYDVLAPLSRAGRFGVALSAPSVPYSVVYHAEVALLFVTLVALGPLVAPLGAARRVTRRAKFGLADLPG